MQVPLSESEQVSAIRAISEAAFDVAAWMPALGWIARAGGGWAAQLMGVHPLFGLLFSFLHGIAPDTTTEFMVEFEARGGENPDINPRARILSREDYEVCRDGDLAPEDEIAHSEFMQDYLYRYDNAASRLARLPGVRGTKLVAVIGRSASQSEFDAADHASFAALLPHVHDAVGLCASLEQRGAKLMAGALEAISYPAFVIDGSHAIVSLTPEADAMLQSGKIVHARRGYLEAFDWRTNALLQDAMRLACLKPGVTWRSQISSVLFHEPRDGLCVAEVAPLPSSSDNLRFGPLAVVAFGRQRHKADVAKLVRQGFDLTRAEAEIALSLLSGTATLQIAMERKSSIETVRTQIKSVFQKIEVDSRAALMRKLAAFIPPPRPGIYDDAQ
jgi:DNA-binding CsgD family transcriptional regulator